MKEEKFIRAGSRVGKSEPHIAELSAQSDLVKLCYEFESLRAQLEANSAEVKQIDDDANAARINFDMGAAHREEKLARLGRARRVLEAQFENVRGLMATNVQPVLNRIGCFAERRS